LCACIDRERSFVHVRGSFVDVCLFTSFLLTWCLCAGEFLTHTASPTHVLPARQNCNPSTFGSEAPVGVCVCVCEECLCVLILWVSREQSSIHTNSVYGNEFVLCERLARSMIVDVWRIVNAFARACSFFVCVV